MRNLYLSQTYSRASTQNHIREKFREVDGGVGCSTVVGNWVNVKATLVLLADAADPTITIKSGRRSIPAGIRLAAGHEMKGIEVRE